jgi:hypothetical protein
VLDSFIYGARILENKSTWVVCFKEKTFKYLKEWLLYQPDILQFIDEKPPKLDYTICSYLLIDDYEAAKKIMDWLTESKYDYSLHSTTNIEINT